MLPRTKRQKEVLDFIISFRQREGHSPSYTQIASGLNVKSKATIAKHIMTLERQGLLKRRREDGLFVLDPKVGELTMRQIKEFERLVESELREEDYQRFLADHLVFIDPLASEVIPKQKLGLEKTTDYAVRRSDNEWILVEIEKPQNRIFTKDDNFTAEFTHAFGQVIEFLEWVDTNAAYARTLMPAISSPKGILIIGRRKALSRKQEAKLKRYRINSQSVEVLTYDDVIQRAKNLHNSIFQ